MIWSCLPRDGKGILPFAVVYNLPPTVFEVEVFLGEPTVPLSIDCVSNSDGSELIFSPDRNPALAKSRNNVIN